MQRKVVATCSALTLVGFSAWAYFEPSFEPVIGMIASFGALAHSYWPKFNSAKVTSLHSREFGALKARWHAEKNLDSPKYDEAKYLLSLMINFLSQLRISEISDQFHDEIDQTMSDLKSVQNMSIYLGKSCFDKFWGEGTDAVESISALVDKI